MDKKIWLIINSYDGMPVTDEPAFLHEERARERAEQLGREEDPPSGDYIVEWLKLDEGQPGAKEKE